jgi:Leucine-rich repeat (LRR) protein
MKNLIFTMFLVLFFFSLETTAQTTSIPDPAFEQALIDLGHDSGPIDGLVTTSNISSLTTLDVYNKGISSLIGIEDFTALTSLYCYYNSLTNLDVSSNTALTKLYCNSNGLTSLDVISNTALTILSCSENSLTSLNVSGNSALTELYCRSNSLTSLDLSSNTPLTTLYCQSNSLTSLNVSSNNALTELYCYSNSLTSLDLSSNTALTNLRSDSNSLTSLDVSSNTALTELYCYSNSLTSLDVSSNTALTYLYCHLNSLTSLDLSNTALITLWCYSNSLTSLDLSSNNALTYLDCDSNSLTSLNVKNGNNTNFTYFDATNNPGLFCIEVDDVAYSDSNWNNKYAGASYSLDCSALSAEVIEINNFSLYPNPVKDYLNISLNEGLELKRATIYNTLGQFIFSTQNLKINTRNIASGIYYIEVETNKGKSAKKILID